MQSEGVVLRDRRHERYVFMTAFEPPQIKPVLVFLFAPQSSHARKPTLHGACVNQPCLLEPKLPLRKHCEIGNATDIVRGCKPRIAFGVHLQHDRAPRHISRSLCYVRCRHPARSAPGSPEVR